MILVEGGQPEIGQCGGRRGDTTCGSHLPGVQAQEAGGVAPEEAVPVWFRKGGEGDLGDLRGEGPAQGVAAIEHVLGPEVGHQRLDHAHFGIAAADVDEGVGEPPQQAEALAPVAAGVGRDQGQFREASG
jgi:hypothetical protein